MQALPPLYTRFPPKEIDTLLDATWTDIQAQVTSNKTRRFATIQFYYEIPTRADLGYTVISNREVRTNQGIIQKKVVQEITIDVNTYDAPRLVRNTLIDLLRYDTPHRLTLSQVHTTIQLS